MAFEPHFSDLLQSTDDSNLEMDDPAPSSTYDLKLTVLFGAIVLVAIYAWCLNCLDRELSEDKEKYRTGEERADVVKDKSDNISDSSTSDVPNPEDQPPASSTAESFGQDADSDEEGLETEGWRVVR